MSQRHYREITQEAPAAETGSPYGLSLRQYGFRKGRSTINAIADEVDIAKKAKRENLKRKGFCALILLDVRNPFNSISWELIMKALEKREIPKYLMKLLESYLNGRKVVYDTEDGPKESRVTAGVPQGLVLGSFMWNVTYDDFLEIKVQEGVILVGFADDVTAVISVETVGELEIKSNDSLNRANLWMQDNGLKLAVLKTEAFLITDRRSFMSLRTARTISTMNGTLFLSAWHGLRIEKI